MPKALLIKLKIDPAAVESKYHLFDHDPITGSFKSDDSTKKVSAVDDLITITRKPISFYDASRRQHNIKVNMIDNINKKALPLSTKVPCFHDHHTFRTSPLGCPVEFVADQLIHKYKTELNKTVVEVKKNIIADDRDLDDRNSDDIVYNNFYYTYGMFCSFNCMLKFARKNKDDPRFRNSIPLINSMYYDLYGHHDKLSEASDFDTITTYDGFQTIEEFRKSFSTVDYVNTRNFYKTIPIMVPVGTMYQAVLKF